MIFPNAKAGVKKLFAAQLLNLISTLFFLAGAMLTVFVTGELSPEKNETAFFIFLGLLAAGTVLSVIGFIIQIIGLNQARRDERLFKKAIYFVIVCAVCTVALMFGNGMFAKIFSGIDEVSTLLIYVYIFLGIYTLAESLGDAFMQKGGKLVLLIVTVMFASALLMQIVAAFIPYRETIVENLDVLTYLVEFIGYITALIYIGMANRMLSKAQ